VVIKTTIPASGADSERNFSCLRRMKTYLRKSTADERSSELVLQTLEKYEGWNFNSGNYLFTTDTK